MEKMFLNWLACIFPFLWDNQFVGVQMKWSWTLMNQVSLKVGFSSPARTCLSGRRPWSRPSWTSSQLHLFVSKVSSLQVFNMLSVLGIQALLSMVFRSEIMPTCTKENIGVQPRYTTGELEYLLGVYRWSPCCCWLYGLSNVMLAHAHSTLSKGSIYLRLWLKEDQWVMDMIQCTRPPPCAGITRSPEHKQTQWQKHWHTDIAPISTQAENRRRHQLYCEAISCSEKRVTVHLKAEMNMCSEDVICMKMRQTEGITKEMVSVLGKRQWEIRGQHSMWGLAWRRAELLLSLCEQMLWINRASGSIVAKIRIRKIIMQLPLVQKKEKMERSGNSDRVHIGLQKRLNEDKYIQMVFWRIVPDQQGSYFIKVRAC